MLPTLLLVLLALACFMAAIPPRPTVPPAQTANTARPAPVVTKPAPEARTVVAPTQTPVPPVPPFPIVNRPASDARPIVDPMETPVPAFRTPEDAERAARATREALVRSSAGELGIDIDSLVSSPANDERRAFRIFLAIVGVMPESARAKHGLCEAARQARLAVACFDATKDKPEPAPLPQPKPKPV